MFPGAFLLMKLLFFSLVLHSASALLFILSGCFHWFLTTSRDFRDSVIIMKLGEHLLSSCNKRFFLSSHKCNRPTFTGFMSSFTHLGYWKNNLKHLLIKSRVASDHFFKILLFSPKFRVSLWRSKTARLWYIYLEKVLYHQYPDLQWQVITWVRNSESKQILLVFKLQFILWWIIESIKGKISFLVMVIEKFCPFQN